MDEKKTCIEKKEINVKSLNKIALYLSGLKDGKGNLLPLGTLDLDNLFEVIAYLQGDVRYSNPKTDLLKDEQTKEAKETKNVYIVQDITPQVYTNGILGCFKFYEHAEKLKRSNSNYEIYRYELLDDEKKIG